MVPRRTIAIGETLWPLTKKIAVDLISDHARAIRKPSQVGGKTPRQRYMSHDSGFMLTGQTPIASPSVLIFAMPSTLLTSQLSSQLSARTFLLSSRSLTAATTTECGCGGCMSPDSPGSPESPESPESPGSADCRG